MKFALIATLLFFAPGVPAPAQQSGTGAIAGTVVRVGTGGPVARAEVTLVPESGTSGARRSASTDSAGRFRFDGVGAGAYRIQAARNGLVPAEFGQRGPGHSGEALALAQGERREDLVVSMTATGAITGRITDENGEPVAFAQVQAHRYVYQNGRRRIEPVQSAQTNDLGEYRLFWMQPGEYVVSVRFSDRPQDFVISSASAFSPQNETREIVISAVVNGGGVPDFLSIAGRPPVSSAGEEVYVPVYYPGTTDPASASVIELLAGTEYSGVDLRTQKIRSVKVSGRVVDGLGGDLPGGVSVRLVPRAGVSTTTGGHGTTVGEGGRFEFAGVVPGSYDLAASSSSTLFARTVLEVGAADVENVTLSLAPGSTVGGRVTIDAIAGAADSPDPASLRIALEAERTLYGGPLRTVTPAPDGSFVLEGVPPNTYWLRVNGLPTGAYVREARLGAADAWSVPFEIQPGPGAALDVRVATDGGIVEAAVMSPDRVRIPDVTVVLVPEPALRQRSDAYRSARSDASGNVRFDSLAPGDYEVFAWDQVPSGAWQNPDFMRGFENAGVGVTLGAGSREPVTLQPLDD